MKLHVNIKVVNKYKKVSFRKTTCDSQLDFKNSVRSKNHTTLKQKHNFEENLFLCWDIDKIRKLVIRYELMNNVIL